MKLNFQIQTDTSYETICNNTIILIGFFKFFFQKLVILFLIFVKKVKKL